MGLEQCVVHLVELALLSSKLSGAQRSPGVDDHVALPHHQADLGRDSLEPPPDLTRSRAAEVGLEWDSLDRRLRMKLKGQPGQVDEAFLFEALDSDRVDVAPGSNVVGEDDQIGWGHARSLASIDALPVIRLPSKTYTQIFFGKPRNLPKNRSSTFPNR